MNKRQTACKPGSVRRLAATRRPFLWDAHCCAPHATNPGDGAEMPLRHVDLRRRSPAAPIRSCSRWGLPCRPCRQGRGALLPPRFTLACDGPKSGAGGLFSVALSLGSPPPAVSRHRIPVEPGLSSSALAHASGRPAVWPASHDGRELARQHAQIAGQQFIELARAGIRQRSWRAGAVGRGSRPPQRPPVQLLQGDALSNRRRYSSHRVVAKRPGLVAPMLRGQTIRPRVASGAATAHEIGSQSQSDASVGSGRS